MKEVDPRAWQQTVRGRVLLAAALFAVWAVAIEARLVWLQVYRHEAMLAEAKAQKDRTRSRSTRGAATSSTGSGRLLAISVDAESVNADADESRAPRDLVVPRCARALGGCSAKEREVFAQRGSQKSRRPRLLRRQVTLDEAATRLAAQKLPGIFTEPEPRRYYPNRELAAHVLGYLGTDITAGLAGIEQSYNSKISGTPGTPDGRGRLAPDRFTAGSSRRRCRATPSSSPSTPISSTSRSGSWNWA